jgi:hypothetical protein
MVVAALNTKENALHNPTPQGRKGFYVDSGANDAENLSNTFFFDKCLGWDGLCVEPQSMYHADILAKRSCKLVPKCISDKVKSVMIEGTGAGIASCYSIVHLSCNLAIKNNILSAPIAIVDRYTFQIPLINHINKRISGANVEEGAGPSSVECESLHDMLKAVGRDSVDLWSLDVEGHEMTVLDSVQFNRLHVNVLLIEDFWISARDLQALMTAKGYVLFQELAVDAVLAKRSFPIPENVWYPVNFDKNNKLNQEYRMVMKDKLVA